MTRDCWKHLHYSNTADLEGDIATYFIQLDCANNKHLTPDCDEN